MDIATLVGSVTALANMVKAWQEVRKARVELTKAQREDIVEAAEDGEFTITKAELESVQQLVISKPLLDALVEDIKRAEARFAKAMLDVTYTPAMLDQEEQIARATICRHLERIKQFNREILPEGDLVRVWQSYRCDNG
jgi:hypothetical protein